MSNGTSSVSRCAVESENKRRIEKKWTEEGEKSVYGREDKCGIEPELADATTASAAKDTPSERLPLCTIQKARVSIRGSPQNEVSDAHITRRKR